MVHSWVIGTSNTSNTTAVRTGAVKRRRTVSASSYSKAWLRAAFVALFALVLFSGLSFMRSFASFGGDVPSAATNEVTVSVASGESLWTIANEWKDESVDTRKAVRDIMKRNGLEQASIRAGQSLILPASMLP